LAFPLDTNIAQCIVQRKQSICLGGFFDPENHTRGFYFSPDREPDVQTSGRSGSRFPFSSFEKMLFATMIRVFGEGYAHAAVPFFETGVEFLGSVLGRIKIGGAHTASKFQRLRRTSAACGKKVKLKDRHN
jgi:hypothetical protein